MLQMLRLTAQNADQRGLARRCEEHPLPRADDHLLSRKQLDTERRVPQTHDSSESYGYKKLTKVIIFLAHNLMGLKQEVNDLKQQIMAVSHKDTSRMELQEEIDRLQETLIQQLNNTQDKLDMFRRELRDSYRRRKETQWERHPTPASSLSRANLPICTKL